MWTSTNSDGTTVAFCRHWCATLAAAVDPSLSAPVEHTRRRTVCTHCAHCGWVLGSAFDRRCLHHDTWPDQCPPRKPELMLTVAAAAGELAMTMPGFDFWPVLVGVEAQLNEAADVHRYATAAQLVAGVLERTHNDARPQEDPGAGIGR